MCRDFTEDHLSMFIHDHPMNIDTKQQLSTSPFYEYKRLFLNLDPISQFVMICIEKRIASEVIDNLVKNKFVYNGLYTQKHLVEELEHGFIYTRVAKIMESSPYGAVAI